jgi:hypothetical protein
VPTAALTGSLENGWSTYQLGDVGSGARDWRAITPTFTGQDVEIWVSFLQPYSTNADKHWSAYFPLTTVTNTDSPLDFLLTVEGVRWQARLKDPDGTGNPSLDKVVVKHAPVSFFATGQTTTLAITPPTRQTLNSWGTLTLNWSLFQPLGSGTGGGTVTVLDGDGNPIAGKTANLTAPGDVTIDLSDITVATHKQLKARIALTSSGTATPIVNSLKVSYLTSASQPTVTLTANPTTITAGQSSTLSGTVVQSGSAVGSASVSILDQGTGAQVASATTNSAGAFSVAVSPTTTTTYVAKYLTSTSGAQTVTVNPAPPPPPKVDLTLAATPSEVIFGQPVTLAGHASQTGVAVPNLAVSLLANNNPFTTATTNATGDYSATNTPQANTVYSATVPNGATTPTANVGVHQLLTLKATRKLATGTFKGAIAPSHPNRQVVIQLKKGTSFVTFAKATTTSTSTYSVKKQLKPCGKFQFRAVTAADADHMDGTSVIALVEKHRVALKVSVKGRKVTFVGRVSPLHKTGSVLIQLKKGTRFVKLAKAKLTRKSAFRLVKAMKKGRYVFRASMPADRCHFAGVSAQRKARVR